MPRVVAIVLAVSLVPSFAQAQAPPTFKDAKLQMQQSEKKRQIDSRLRYETEALIIQPDDAKLTDSTRTLKYADITGAEYTFGKSPRVAAALLVSPMFLFNSSMSHWLTVKTGDDYALLRVDKSNYELVIAELEKRAHITVASVGENK